MMTKAIIPFLTFARLDYCIAVVCLVMFVLPCDAQNIATRPQLQRAEALFKQRNYAAALPLYESAWQQDPNHRVSVLLKLAFIHEGLHHYPEALYYLNLYYLAKPRLETITYMGKLAESQKLRGYEYSDWAYFSALWAQYGEPNARILLVLGVFGVAYLYYRRRRGREVPLRHKIAMLIVLTLFLGGLLWVRADAYAIVWRNYTYIMSAPSSGEQLVGTLNRGNRVRILREVDTWYEVECAGVRGYVRAGQVRLVKF